MERNCRHCGKRFVASRTQIKNAQGKFCSKKCYHEAHAAEATCRNCGKRFRCAVSRLSTVRFCSRKCHAEKRRSDACVLAKCRECKKQFHLRKTERSKWKGFCSRKCSNKHHVRTRICKNCGTLFTTKACFVKKGGGKFCTVKCRAEYFHRISVRRRRKESRPCKQCGKAVERYPSQFKQGRGRFCSKACLNLYKHEQGSIPLNCQHCGSEFRIAKSRSSAVQDGKLGKFCSKKCAIKGLENHKIEQCVVCGNPFKVIPYRTEKGHPQSCSKFCENQLRKSRGIRSSLKQMFYTPELLRSFITQTGEICNFPGCAAKRNEKNRWALCDPHQQRTNHALQERRRRREAILRREGLT